MKKNIVIITIFSLIVLLLMPVLANADTTTSSANNNADALNKLSILAGDGTSYNLDGQLKRSEAIAFIVRIMGKESFVKSNSAFYSKTTFPDVKSTDWFASYVGYCEEQNLLKGFPDGKFHSNESISEQAFLNLVLGALGFTVGKDFVWETIYASAYNRGLVIDDKYKTQTKDNSKYTRADVVNVLYNSLTALMKDSKSTLIEKLIADKTIDRAIAVQLGLVKEIVQAKIDSVQAVDTTTLNVNFSKTVNALAAKDITIYETDNKANKLQATVTSLVYSKLVLTTTSQIPDKNYSIEINSSVENSDTVGLATSNFKGYVVPEVKSNYFKINKVVPISKNVINVYFTQPITSDVAVPIFYELLKNNNSFVKGSKNNMIVKVLSDQDNVISIYLKDSTIAEETAYSLRLSGEITSAYGVQLNDGLGDSVIFAGKTVENEKLKINNVYTVDTNTLRLDFNKELDPTTAQQLGNYQITSTTGIPVTVNKATLPAYGKGEEVLLDIAGLFDKTLNYQLVIKYTNDIFNIDSVPEVNYLFAGKPAIDPKDLSIIQVAAIDKSTLQVYFDKKIDATAGSNSAYYLFTGVTDPSFITIPSKVTMNPLEPTFVKIYLPAGKEILRSNAYKLKVLNVLPDESGNGSLIDSTLTFNGSSNLDIKPLITEAMIIGKDTIRITSSKELLNSGSNLMLNNYSLELQDGKNTLILKTPSSIIAYDSSTLILHFDNLDVSKTYNFKFNSLTDISGLNVRTILDGFTSTTLKNGA